MHEASVSSSEGIQMACTKSKALLGVRSCFSSQMKILYRYFKNLGA